jgi:hypothetical protein
MGSKTRSSGKNKQTTVDTSAERKSLRQERTTLTENVLPQVYEAPKRESSLPSTTATTQPTTPAIPAELKSEQRTSGLPVGAWIGIGFAISLVVILGVLLFFGQKRVTESLVKFMSRRKKPEAVDPILLSQGKVTVPLPARSYSVQSKASRAWSGSTPRTIIPDLPFASIEVEPDGRLSPRLPIANKRGGSLPGTPNSVSRRDV